MSGDMRSNPLRREAERLLGGQVKLFRGAGLYFAPRTEGVGIPRSDLLLAAERGQSAVLNPKPGAVTAFEEWARVKPEGLGQELMRLRDEPITPPELELFAQGVKQLEMGVAPAIWLRYDKRIRQLCADCLRECRGGGALYACWVCMNKGGLK